MKTCLVKCSSRQPKRREFEYFIDKIVPDNSRITKFLLDRGNFCDLTSLLIPSQIRYLIIEADEVKSVKRARHWENVNTLNTTRERKMG